MWPLRSLKNLPNDGRRSNAQSQHNKPPEIMVVGKGHCEERRKAEEGEIKTARFTLKSRRIWVKEDTMSTGKTCRPSPWPSLC